MEKGTFYFRAVLEPKRFNLIREMLFFKNRFPPRGAKIEFFVTRFGKGGCLIFDDGLSKNLS